MAPVLTSASSRQCTVTRLNCNCLQLQLPEGTACCTFPRNQHRGARQASWAGFLKFAHPPFDCLAANACHWRTVTLYQLPHWRRQLSVHPAGGLHGRGGNLKRDLWLLSLPLALLAGMRLACALDLNRRGAHVCAVYSLI